MEERPIWTRRHREPFRFLEMLLPNFEFTRYEYQEEEIDDVGIVTYSEEKAPDTILEIKFFKRLKGALSLKEKRIFLKVMINGIIRNLNMEDEK